MSLKWAAKSTFIVEVLNLFASTHPTLIFICLLFCERSWGAGAHVHRWLRNRRSALWAHHLKGQISLSKLFFMHKQIRQLNAAAIKVKTYITCLISEYDTEINWNLILEFYIPVMSIKLLFFFYILILAFICRQID